MSRPKPVQARARCGSAATARAATLLGHAFAQPARSAWLRWWRGSKPNRPVLPRQAHDQPHHELAALELAGRGEPAPPSDAGALLDDAAKRAYRQRVTELREELEEAERWNDPERAERASAELELISGELSRAVGLAGRDRRAAYCRYAPAAGDEVAWHVER